MLNKLIDLFPYIDVFFSKEAISKPKIPRTFR